MSLKMIIDSLDDVSDELKSEYEEKDGKFHLKVDGLEDTGALKRAKEHEKNQRKEAERKLRETEQRLADKEAEFDESKRKQDRNNGDIDALEKSWQSKFDARETELKDEIDRLSGAMRTGKLNSVANELAAELAGESAAVLLPHIKSRLDVVEKDGELSVSVKDTSGNASAMSIDELKQEFTGNKAFSAVIVGSGASGSGAGRSGSGGEGGQKIDLTKANTKEFAEYLKAKKESS